MTEFDFQNTLEFSDPAKIRNAQETALKRHVEYLAASSPYYRELFRSKQVDIAKITLENLRELPLTDKAVLAEHNKDFLAVPLSEVVDIVLSSGTTGKPTTIWYTENDLQRLAYNEHISFLSCGLSNTDVVLLTCTMDRCFIAGLAYFSGIRSVGAAAIRNGLSSVESHRELIQRLKPTAIVGVPTFLLKLGRYLQSCNIEPALIGVKKLICIGEPLRDQNLAFLRIGENLERLWGASIYSTYASTETITSFCECTAQQGGHLHPDLAVVEIVNDRGEIVAPGEIGEVVMTPLGIQGTPLLRFKTGDISFLIEDWCACGRNSPRLGPILGRKKQMIKLHGTTLYPNSFHAVLDTLPEVGDYYITVSSNYDLSDIVSVHVALKNGSSAEAIAEKLQAGLRVRPHVIVESEESIKQVVYAGHSRKLIRFVDKRQNL